MHTCKSIPRFPPVRPRIRKHHHGNEKEAQIGIGIDFLPEKRLNRSRFAEIDQRTLLRHPIPPQASPLRKGTVEQGHQQSHGQRTQKGKNPGILYAGILQCLSFWAKLWPSPAETSSKTRISPKSTSSEKLHDHDGDQSINAESDEGKLENLNGFFAESVLGITFKSAHAPRS